MPSKKKRELSRLTVSSILMVVGVAIVCLGWRIPSRFKSIPRAILHEAGTRSESIVDLAKEAIAEEDIGVAEQFLQAAETAELDATQEPKERLEQIKSENPVLWRWGGWDPFLESALRGIPLDDYSTQPGMLGIALSQPCREALGSLLENSREPLVRGLLETGTYTTYKRLFPVQSVSGRPLEATLLSLGLLAQGDRFAPALKRVLRERIEDARVSGDVAALEDFYLDVLSLARALNWGQFEALMARLEDFETVSRVRYALHRRPDMGPLIFTSVMIASDSKEVMDYLGLYGDEGVESIRVALGYGVEAVRMLVREQLPLELNEGRLTVNSFDSFLISFSLQNPRLSLTLKYILFFAGAFFAFWGSGGLNRFYGESNPPLLVGTQRLFASLASVVVLVVLSEPYLAGGGLAEGYSFKIVMPVLAQVDGETIIVETEPSTSMEPTTLLSISFFFVLQILVFLICFLKVRQINNTDLDNLVKLKLMENEENLFDSGLYVGIAGTCVSLVLQVLGIIEANLIAAYSSNLFGILGVAIVKIQLVRPFKNKLILASQDQLASLMVKQKTA